VSKSWFEMKVLVVGMRGMYKVGTSWPLLMEAKWNHLYTQ
jgi:hypothetical protein